MPDTIEKLGNSVIQHGKDSDRIYLMKHGPEDVPVLVEQMERLAEANDYGKIFCKVPDSAVEAFLQAGYCEEARIPKLFCGSEDAAFMSRFRKSERSQMPDEQRVAIEQALIVAKKKRPYRSVHAKTDYQLKQLNASDTAPLANLYRKVFPSYPFPILDEAYLRETLASHIRYFGAFDDGRLVAASSAETDLDALNAEMTDFATDPDYRRKGLAVGLLKAMEQNMQTAGCATLYTIARAVSVAMNITFARCGYLFAGTLVNNTQISGSLESMNVWYKSLSSVS